MVKKMSECKFCEKIYTANDKTPNAEDYIFIENGIFNIAAYTGDSFCWGSIENIKLCPYCGRNLSEEKQTVY